MKKLILTAGLVALVAASSFAQGSITFKITGKSFIYSATDGTTASLALVPTSGQVGSFGTVQYELFSAPSTTALVTDASQFLVGGGISAPNGWTATAVGPVTYSQAGGVNSVILSLPVSSGAPAANVDLEIVAFTGTLSNPTLFGYSGQTFPTITSTGAFSWSEPTGNPTTTPAGTPGSIPTGTAGFGSIILEQVPEPSTIALGGLAAAALLAFRRRK